MKIALIFVFNIIIITTAFSQSSNAEGNLSALDYISTYQKYLSPYKYGHCSHYPSCSSYAKEVFSQRPFFDALTLSAERIMRCGYDKDMYEYTFINETKSVLDPPPYQEFPDSLAYHIPIYPHVDIKKEKEPTEIGFVDYLINNMKYQEALLEIERLTYYGNIAENQLYTRKLKSYLGIDRVDKAILYYENKINKDTTKYTEVQLQASLLYYKANLYNRALTALDYINTVATDSIYRSKASAISGVTYFALDRTDLAEQNFRNAYEYDTSIQSRYENNVNILNSYKKEKQKNPKIASLLSIIPGGGYLYSGHKGSAISAFLFDAVFGYAAYTSFSRKNYGVGALFGILSASFYIGNIRGASNSVDRYNKMQKKRYLEELENNNIIFINY